MTVSREITRAKGLEMNRREMLGYLLDRYCTHYANYKTAKKYADDSKAFKFLADELFTRSQELESILKDCFDVDAFQFWLDSIED